MVNKLVDWTSVGFLGFALVIIGLVIVFLATFLLAFSPTRTKGKAKGGGIVFIGPIPIIFGTDKESVKILLILAIILLALMIVFLFLTYNTR